MLTKNFVTLYERRVIQSKLAIRAGQSQRQGEMGLRLGTVFSGCLLVLFEPIISTPFPLRNFVR